MHRYIDLRIPCEKNELTAFLNNSTVISKTLRPLSNQLVAGRTKENIVDESWKKKQKNTEPRNITFYELHIPSVIEQTHSTKSNIQIF